MRPAEVTETLRSLLRTRVPVFLWGPPGVGKSSIVKQASEEFGEFHDVRLVYHDPSDMKFPVVKGDTVLWINTLLPKDPEWRGIICLEELPQCAPLVQASAMQLTLDRRIGSYVLPREAYIVACGNRAEDRAGAHRIITPLLNRFLHLDCDVSNDDWHAWATTADVAPEVDAFLRFRPNLLFQFDASSQQRAFPTPRSWKFVSDVLKSTPSHLIHPVVSGCVGEGPAAEFCGFLQVWGRLPDIDKIIAAPATHPVPKNEPAVLYALYGALVSRLKQAEAATIRAIGQFATRLPLEIAAVTIQQGAALQRSLLAAPGMSQWMAAHKDIILGGKT